MLRQRANFKRASFEKVFSFSLNNTGCATVQVKVLDNKRWGVSFMHANKTSTSNRVAALLYAHLVGGHLGFGFGHKSNVT